MFVALASILSPNQTLDLAVTLAADGSMKVVVKPQLVKGSNVSLAIPLALSATPQELDTDFVGALMRYAGDRASLQQQVDTTALIIAEAKKSEVGKASKAIKSGAKPSDYVAGKAADDAGDEGEGSNAIDADDILDDAPAASTPAASAPAAQAAPAAAGTDDLLSLLGA